MDENIVFRNTYMKLVSRTNIPSKTIESISYGLSVCRTNDNEDNSFIINLILKGTINKDEYLEIRGRYSTLFYLPVSKVFNCSDSISSSRLIYYAADLNSASRGLEHVRSKNSKPDYFDQLSDLKSRNNNKWFYTSH